MHSRHLRPIILFRHVQHGNLCSENLELVLIVAWHLDCINESGMKQALKKLLEQKS